MLNQSKTHCIIRLTFEAYVDSLSVKSVGNTFFENQYVGLSGFSFIYYVQSSILQNRFMSMV